MDELKPCPFCGGKARLSRAGAKYIIFCHNCVRLPADGGYIRQEDAIAAWNNRTDGWISVEDRLPDNEVDVLISGRKFATGKKFVTQAFYEDGTMTIDDSWYDWYDYDCNYDENTDQYIVPQGWWEAATYCEQFAAVDDFVTHWQPLPAPPEGE